MSKNETNSRLLSLEFIEELKLFWSQRHGSEAISPYHLSLDKLENAQLDSERVEAGEELFNDLLVQWDNNIKKLEPTLTGREAYNADWFYETTSPFLEQQTFFNALHGLKNDLVSTKYDEAQVLIVYHAYLLTQYLIEQATFADQIECLNSLANDFERLVQGREIINDSLIKLFSSVTGIHSEINDSDFRQSVNYYRESIYYKKYDRVFRSFLSVYRDRVWKNDKEMTSVTAHHQDFMNALLQLRTIYFNSPRNNPNEQKKINSMVAYANVLVDILLDRYKKQSHNENLQAIEEFKRLCEEALDDSPFLSFAKAVAAVILTAFAYLSIAGAVYFHLKDQTPLKVAKQTCGIPSYNSVWRHLTFRPTGIQSRINDIAELAPIESENITAGWQIYK